MILLNRKIITFAILYLGLIIVGVVFGVKPLLAGVQERQANLQIEYDKYRRANTKLTQLSELSRSKSNIESAKQIADAAIPETLDQDRLTLTLEKMVADLGLRLTALSTTANKTTPVAAAGSTASPSANPTTGSDTSSAIKATLGVSGQFSDIITLQNKLEKMVRIMVINSLTMTSTDDPTNIDVQITLTAYGRSDKL